MLYDGFQCGKRVGDININYATAGRGPPLLLLHGFPQNLAMWARVVPILAADFTMVCADLRGNGDSSRPACARQGQLFLPRAGRRPQIFRHWCGVAERKPARPAFFH
jgi:pimeloyl-ACP methyl ester carboxylesterase